jgi:hypothetical protein
MAPHPALIFPRQADERFEAAHAEGKGRDRRKIGEGDAPRRQSAVPIERLPPGPVEELRVDGGLMAR